MDFAYKAVLTAMVVAMVMLASRAFGDRVAGILAGLPFTTVPALMWIGIEHGEAIAGQVAVGSVTGCGVAAVFSIAYDRAARRFGPRPSVVVGVAALAASALAAHGLDAGLAAASALAIGAGVAALAFMRSDAVAALASAPKAATRVALTAVSAGATSALLSALALGLSASLAGLLASLPIVGVAAVTAEHAARGTGSVTPFLRGYVLSALAKAGFGVVFAVCVVPIGVVNAMGVALLTGAVLGGLGNRWLQSTAGASSLRWPGDAVFAQLGDRPGP